MLDGIVPIRILNDLIQVEHYLLEDELTSLLMGLEFTHQVLQNTQTILVVHYIQKVLHKGIKYETQLLHTKTTNDLLDEVRTLTIQHQRHYVILYGLLYEFLLLTWTNQWYETLNSMSTFLVACDLHQPRTNYPQYVETLRWHTILTQTPEQVISIRINHQVRDLILHLPNNHIHIWLSARVKELLD